MGKKIKPLGVKRKRGKKFEWRGEISQSQQSSIKSKSIFRDQRLGQKNPSLDKEQKYLLRYQRERDFLSRRKQKFELDDTLELTHKGMKLSDLKDDYVEDYDLDLSDEDDFKSKKLPRMDDDLVNEMHFGDEKHRSKKNAYEELIQKSKQNKLIRQQEKEENLEITRKLDGDFMDITKRLKFKNKTQNAEADEYDNLLLEIREDAKVQAEYGMVNKSYKQAREAWEEAGENWAVPEDYKEFVVIIRENPISCIEKYKTWSECETKKTKLASQTRLLQFSLKFFIHSFDSESLDTHDELIEFIYNLSKEHANIAEGLFISSALELGNTLPLSLVYYYFLVSKLFTISFSDTLTSALSTLAGCIFTEYPLTTYKTIRNMLLLARVYTQHWLCGKYSPELIRGLIRVIEKFKGSVIIQEFNIDVLFNQENDNALFTFAYKMMHEQKTLFGKFLNFEGVLVDVEMEVSSQPEPMKMYEKPVEEIQTYEPLVFGKIRSNKKNRDTNKEVTELDKLREQAKKAKKMAKRVLEKETEGVMFEKNQEFKAGQEEKTVKQNLVKNMLDELQSEYKRFSTTMEKKKDRKKRKKRMGGGRTEQNS
ncbi:hypothetical protein SteCoe_10197 [Stentor coeruleus]|uniref:Uncharacterized protein n=1 Tax=Stentor coeruleus TaxID=5963 RepID=A0A1R2CG09_9CILI|nr:hypothetical protein SteCoe_10197 [Stentor coeruleus]